MIAEFIPGIHANLAGAEYHAIEAMSSSGAKKMLQSPAHYRLMRDTQIEPTEAMRIGTAVHTLILEPNRADEVVALPEVNARTKDGRAELEAWHAANAGKQGFASDTLARIHAAVAAVRAHPGATMLLSDGEPEVSLLWRDSQYDVQCKARDDWLRRDGGIVDLKTTRDASADGFGRTIASFMYHVQAAFYWIGHEHLFDRSPEFFAFVAVETEPPFGVATYVLQSDAIRAGMRHVEVALRRYREALDSGHWPGYAEEIQPISVPRWALTFKEM